MKPLALEKNPKKKRFDEKTLQEAVNKMFQEILKTMIQDLIVNSEKTIVEDEQRIDTPMPTQLSCPNNNVSSK